MRTHKRAVTIICVASVLDLIGGLVFAALEHLSAGIGLYWAFATATTVGYGDVIPHDTAGRLVSIVVMLTVVPLFAAAFSLVTSGLTTTHVRRHSERIEARVMHLIHHAPDVPEYEEHN